MLSRWWQRFRSLDRKWQAAIAAIVVIALIAAVSGGGEEDKKPTAATTTTRDADEADRSENRTTSTAKRTTTTRKPTTTTTTAPPAEPTVYEGRGDDVVEITKPTSGPAIAVFSHSGTSNFQVVSLDASREPIDYLVNQIGIYLGSRPLDFQDGENTVYLEINADGPWRAELQPLDMARKFDGSTTGRGEEVFAYAGSGGIAHLTHNGESNFQVITYGADGTEYLVNEIGPYDGRVPIDGFVLVDISADGEWSITVE
jgi:hypothetical protein